MKILVLIHAKTEGPGSLGDYLVARNVTLRTCSLFNTEPLPRDPAAFDAIVSMGGPMNVHEEEKYPFLKEETLFLRRAIDSRVPILGICLGAQMIAKACGAAVKKAPVRELGWSRVRLTSAGRTDPLFHGMPDTLPVFQWHDDTFEVPAGGFRLATSRECPNQAFRYRNAYGLQFHAEITQEILESWFDDPGQRRQMVDQYLEREAELTTNARTLYANLLARIWEGQANGA
jgi:GMP synthase-like glutamine amidotransferase